jgi:hypothetical protein
MIRLKIKEFTSDQAGKTIIQWKTFKIYLPVGLERLLKSFDGDMEIVGMIEEENNENRD